VADLRLEQRLLELLRSADASHQPEPMGLSLAELLETLENVDKAQSETGPPEPAETGTCRRIGQRPQTTLVFIKSKHSKRIKKNTTTWTSLFGFFRYYRYSKRCEGTQAIEEFG